VKCAFSPGVFKTSGRCTAGKGACRGERRGDERVRIHVLRVIGVCRFVVLVRVAYREGGEGILMLRRSGRRTLQGL